MSIDRDDLIDCLERLGDEDDATALAAAREAQGMLTAAGLDWADVVVKGLKARNAEPKMALGDDDDSVARAIKALLAKPDLGDSTREDVEDFQRELADGTLDPGDRAYILKLYARVS